MGSANVYQLHKELEKLPPKPPVLEILVSFLIQGQCELSECEQPRRIRQCLSVHDPQESGAWTLHSAGTVPRQGHSTLTDSAATGTSGLKCGVNPAQLKQTVNEHSRGSLVEIIPDCMGTVLRCWSSLRLL